MDKSRDIELKVGRRSSDGTVRISPYPPELLQLSVSYKGERAASVVLTREQVRSLRDALTEFEKEMSPPNGVSEPWDNTERRSEESLLTPEGHY
jgi:hypothetical protein